MLYLISIIYILIYITRNTTMTRLALGPTQPPIQWLGGAPSLGIRQLGHEADHSSPSSAEVKNA